MAQKDDGGYWPGFVDALTNVVFVMIIVVVLLMLMFMATLLKVVNVERERMVAQRVASEAVEKVEALKEAPAAAESQPKAPQSKPTPAAPAVAAVYVAPSNRIKPGNGEVSLDGALAFVVFPSRESAMDEKAIGELKTLLAPKLDSIRAHGVALRADAVPAFVSEGRRLGYYRIVAIREWLVSQGVPADKIDLRIADVPSVEGKQGVLMLARQPAAAAAQPQSQPE